MPVKGTSKVLGDLSDFLRVASDNKARPLFKFGLIKLNNLIGNYGGIPGGSLIQLLADPKCGKTTLALDLLAHAQKDTIQELEVQLGKQTKIINAAYVDFERSFDPVYAGMLGVDLEKLLVIETPYANDSFKIVEHLLSEGLQFVVFDSVAMIVPDSEEDKEVTESEKMAASAGLLTRNIKRLIPLADNANALVVIINQFRANISPMSHKEKKPHGAHIIQYASKLTIELRRKVNEAEKTRVEAYVAKTKFGAEGKKYEFDIVFGKGPDYLKEVLTLALEYDIIKEPSKGRFEYGEFRAHGIEQAKEKFPIEEIKQKVLEVI